jgi:hypothetical protein
MVSMDGNPLLNSGELVDSEASGSNPPSPLNLCYTSGYYLPFRCGDQYLRLAQLEIALTWQVRN